MGKSAGAKQGVSSSGRGRSGVDDAIDPSINAEPSAAAAAGAPSPSSVPPPAPSEAREAPPLPLRPRSRKAEQPPRLACAPCGVDDSNDAGPTTPTPTPTTPTPPPPPPLASFLDPRDEITALAASDRCVLVGTRRGCVHVLDVEGNATRSRARPGSGSSASSAASTIASSLSTIR